MERPQTALHLSCLHDIKDVMSCKQHRDLIAMNHSVIRPHRQSAFAIRRSLPVVFHDAGPEAVKAFGTFFTDQIRNANTREAYLRNACRFFAWCDEHGLSLPEIESYHISAYIEELRLTASDATVKQHLASIKMLFDWLVIQQIVPRNPAAAVRGPKLTVHRGKTPVLDEVSARLFFESFAWRAAEQNRPLHVVELRDRAICAVMTYALPRVSSVCGMKVGDFYPNGRFWRLRFTAKGGKFQDMPAHHKLVEYLDAYLAAAGIAEDRKGWLFRSVHGRSQELTQKPLLRQNVWGMVKRRARAAGIRMDVCNHTFRGTGITNYMKNDGALKHAQHMAGHADPRTTQLYDHSGDEAMIDEIERIRI